MRDLWFFVWERFAGMEGTRGVRPVNGAIFARSDRFRHDEPEHGVLLARSVFVQLEHAQNKSCGLAAEIQARIRRCRVFVYRDLKV